MTRVVAAGRNRRAAVENLLQLYQHYFSRMLGREVDRRGRFNFVRLPGAWKAPRRNVPFLILEGGRIAGFAFVRRGRLGNGAEGSDLQEFFVLERYRRRGVGSRAARAVFRRFPGWWQVKVLVKNRPARSFWRRVIRREAGGRLRSGVSGDMVCHLFMGSVRPGGRSRARVGVRRLSRRG